MHAGALTKGYGGSPPSGRSVSPPRTGPFFVPRPTTVSARPSRTPACGVGAPSRRGRRNPPQPGDAAPRSADAVPRGRQTQSPAVGRRSPLPLGRSGPLAVRRRSPFRSGRAQPLSIGQAQPLPLGTHGPLPVGGRRRGRRPPAPPARRKAAAAPPAALRNPPYGPTARVPRALGPRTRWPRPGAAGVGFASGDRPAEPPDRQRTGPALGRAPSPGRACPISTEGLTIT